MSTWPRIQQIGDRRLSFDLAASASSCCCCLRAAASAFFCAIARCVAVLLSASESEESESDSGFVDWPVASGLDVDRDGRVVCAWSRLM